MTLTDNPMPQPNVHPYPEFIQLLDGDIVSLIGLTLVVDPLHDPMHFPISQRSLLLYLMTQCQMKLHHPVTSLATTLDYVKVARRRPNYTEASRRPTFEQLLLKLVERKIRIYLCNEIENMTSQFRIM